MACIAAHMVRQEPGLAGQAPLGSLWQEQTGGSRAKAKYKDKVLEMQCQGESTLGISSSLPVVRHATCETITRNFYNTTFGGMSVKAGKRTADRLCRSLITNRV